MRKVLPVTMAAALILLFVAANVYVSQTFHPLLYAILGPITETSEASTKQYLSYIEETPEYEQQYAYHNRLYNNAFAQEDIQAEFSLNNELEKHMDLLERSPETPGILVKIALVHLDRGDLVQARQFYERAQAIDPWVEVEELERLF